MRAIKKGATDQSVVIRIIDSTTFVPETAVEYDTAGIALWYRREGATNTAITEAALAALDSAHADGGIEHIGDGYYRLDLPDAAVATGANGVMVGGTVTGMIVIGCYVHLIDYDPQDTVRLGLTALPNAAADAAGGLPISDAGGLDIDAKLANTNEITAARMAALTDWINGGRLDLILDIIAVDVAGLDGAAMRGTDSAALASVCTEARLSELDAGTPGKAAAEIDLIKTDAAAILVDTGTDGVVLPQAQADKVWGTAARVLTANTNLNDPTAATIADAVWDELVTGHDGAGKAGAQLWTDIDAIAVDVAGLDGAAMRGTDSAALASVCTEARLAELDAANLIADVAAVKVDTASVLADTGTDGVVVAAASKTGYTIAAGGIPVGGYAAGAITDAAIAVDAETAIAAAVLARQIEAQGTYTLQQAMSIILATVAGVTADAGATLKTPNGVATRVAATINASNERTAMTLTPSA